MWYVHRQISQPFVPDDCKGSDDSFSTKVLFSFCLSRTTEMLINVNYDAKQSYQGGRSLTPNSLMNKCNT